MLSEKKYGEFTLLSLLAQNSEYAFQLIFDRYRDTIYKVAMMYVKSPVIAEEIVQDVFLKLWFHRATMPEINNLEAWLFTLTKNLTLNSLKKIAHEWTAREKWMDEHSLLENSADHKLLTTESLQMVQQAIKNLSPQQQEVYRLAKEQGLSYEEIALQLNISRLTVKTHMSRALASIRLYLQQHGGLTVWLVLAGALTR